MFLLILVLTIFQTSYAQSKCAAKNITDVGLIPPVSNCTYKGFNVANAFTPCSEAEEVKTKFRVFSKDKPNDETILNTKFEKQEGLFTSNHFTVFVTHGWMSGANMQPHFYEIKDLFFKKKNNKINFVIVDWSDGAQNPIYQQSVANTRVVGKQIAVFIEQLNSYYNVTPGRIILNGHSLGAQIMGIAGREVFKKLNKKVLQLNGEDPAGPCWETEEDHIQPTDAKVVQIFHTDADSLGTENVAGQYDFYLNDGKTQPNCGTRLFGLRIPGFAAICDHLRVLEVLRINYEDKENSEICEPMAYQCESFEDYNAGKCASCEDEACQVLGYGIQIQDNIIKPRRIKMNDTINRQGFYMKSAGSPQYCQYQFQVIAKCKEECDCTKMTLSLSQEGTELPSFKLNKFNDTFCTALFTFSPEKLETQQLQPFSEATITSASVSTTLVFFSSSVPTNDASKVESIELNYLSNRNETIRAKYSSNLCSSDRDNAENNTNKLSKCSSEAQEEK